MPRKVVITGASGNVGTALLHLFAEQEPDTEIVAIARRTPPSTHPYDRAQWHNIDLARADAGVVTLADLRRPMLTGSPNPGLAEAYPRRSTASTRSPK
ncbi:NAD-dependent epimerase/dehydratase family protein [Rhodococcus sp. (in: high G+C Gram-positive bacteria)]|uniref:NAD-dependent epimerase/dehydratase family protein n=1 Tax=Rhodococcus sp. TaxID=1831 RepID=UPI003BB1AE40